MPTGQQISSLPEIHVEHVEHQSLVDVSRGHLIFQQFHKFLSWRGEVPLENFQLGLVDCPLVFHVVDDEQR
jgi:hypothetical protein